jgi:hypothetical protein
MRFKPAKVNVAKLPLCTTAGATEVSEGSVVNTVMAMPPLDAAYAPVAEPSVL